MRSIGMGWIVSAAAFAGAGTVAAQPPQGAAPAPGRAYVGPGSPVAMVDARPAFQEPSPRQAVPIGAVEDMREGGVEILNSSPNGSCYDAIGCYEESCCREGGRGPLARFKGAMAHWRHGGADCQAYPCADCYSWLDVEKRLFFGYVYGNAAKPNTRHGVNDFDGGQIAAEFLPWVLQDGSAVFTRHGFTVMYQYSRFVGNPITQFRSDLSGGLASVDGGDMHSLVVGWTYRLDTDVVWVRFSPNATLGATFDWIDVDPVPGRGGSTFALDSFKYTGFDCGFYARLMFDFGLTEKINFGIGMDFRASDTEVMQDDLRKHMGFVIGLSHTF